MLEPQDRNVVTGQIAVLDQNISRLEDIESKLSWQLSEIQSKLKALRDQRAALESRIAVVWSLPNEILAYIFELGVRNEEAGIEAETDDDDDDDDDDDRHEDESAFNVLVSHVCRTFREIAIHTPTLWTQIHILDLEPPRLDYVRACVKRSGSSGLDIFIDCVGGRFEGDLTPISSLMDILDPHIGRFKRLTVRLSGFLSLYQVMVRLNKPAPQLETLELSNFDTDDDFEEDPASLQEPLTLFNGIMPKLECVSLDGAHTSWAKCNFSGLESLHLGYFTPEVRPTYDEFKAIIDASPTLHTLELRRSPPLISNDSQPSLYPPLQMERLEELHISEMPCDIATTLMSLFNIPNLLSLSLMGLITNGDSASFHRIIGPPVLFPALTTLKLGSVDLNEVIFEDLLRASSKLTHLTLYFSSHRHNTWLVCLEPKGLENEVVCPKLECLKCINASPDELRTLLERRRDAGFPIPTLQLDKESTNWYGQSLSWLMENATVQLIDPSEPGTDHEMDGSGSDWATEEDDIGGFPITMGGFSDDDDEEEYEDTSEMEIDQTDDSEIEEDEEDEEEEPIIF